jgi:hypothetical protein
MEQEMRKLWAFENKWGRREKQKEKTCFIIWKSLFIFLLFYNYSFASAVQRQIEKLLQVFNKNWLKKKLKLALP